MPYKPITILSTNRKCGSSLDLPTKGHCNPTKICSFACYARTGPQAWTNSTRKHEWTSKYLSGSDISQLIKECSKQPSVRLNGSGDLLDEHALNIVRLAKACPSTIFWGMTRRLTIAKTLNKTRLPNLRILVTVDDSSPQTLWNYEGKLCYGPRRAEDKVPADSRILTVFPRHFAGAIVNNVPPHKKDCPAVRHLIDGCINCKRCYSWW